MLKRIVWFLLNRRFVLMVVAGFVFIISVYCYLYSHDLNFQIVSLVVSYVALIAVIYVFVCFFRGLNKQGFEDRGESILQNDIDEFNQLATRMEIKLDDRRPYRKVKRLYGIGANILRFKPYIIVGEELYVVLKPNERLAVMAHEFAHIKMKHLLIRAGSLVVMLALVLYGLHGLHGLSLFQLNFHQRLLCICVILTSPFMAVWISSYFCEYWADAVAIDYTKDKGVYISALEQAGREYDPDRQFLTHPSTKARIARVSKLPAK